MAERGPGSVALGGGFGRVGPGPRRALAACASAFALSTGAAARADEGPKRADMLFKQGREAMRRGDLEEACPKFAESQQLDPSAGTLLNLAVCEQRKGEGARSWAHFQELAESLPPDDDRLPFARSWAETLAKRLPRLTLRLGPDAPPNTRVWLDGVELDASRFGVAFVVDPGAHAVVVRAPDRVERRYHLEAEPGQASSLTVMPSSTPAPGALTKLQADVPPKPPVAPRPRKPSPQPLSFEQKSGYTLLAVGGAAVAVGALSGFFALEQARDADKRCPNEQCTSAGRNLRDNARALTLVSALTAGGGLVVGTVGGVVLWQSAPKSQVAAFRSAVMTRGAGLAWQLTFLR